MPTIVSRRNKDQKIKDGRCKLPAYQSLATLGYQTCYAINIQPAPSANALTSSSQIYFDLEEYECDQIDKVAMRFRIRAINDTWLVPIWYWFREWEIRFQKGSGDIGNRLFPENFYLYYYLTMNEEERKIWEDLSNFSVRMDPKTKRQSVYTDLKKNVIPAGETRDIYVHIPITWLQTSQIDMRTILSELRFQMETAGNAILLNGTTQADFELEDINMIIMSMAETASDTQARISTQRNHKHKYIYLDCEKLTYNTRTLQSNSRQRFNLDQFQNKCPFLFFVFKPNTNPTGEDLYTFRELGDEGTIDFENSGGKSIHGNGRPIKNREYFKEYTEQTGNYPIKGGYIMNFSDDIKLSMAGVLNSLIQFDGSNYYLSFEFGDEAVSEVHRWQGFTTPGFNALTNPMSNGGVGNLVVNGVINPEPINVGNRTDYRNRFDESLEKYGISLDNTSGSNYDQVVDITFTKQSGDVSNRIGIPTYINQVPATDSLDPSLFVYNRPRITQRGKDGWISGSNYSLEIFCYKFKELLIDTNGHLSCRDL